MDAQPTITQAIAQTIDVLCASGRPDLAEVVANTWGDSKTDRVTGLHNRTSFEELLEYERDRAHRYGRKLSLLVLDIDDFKKVNDTLGHLAGDDVLRCIATNLESACRVTDRASRIGGDEFAIILPETDFAAALDIGSRVEKQLAGLHVVTCGGPTKTSVTVGVATLCEADTCSSLFDRADQALLSKKGRRRTRRHASGARRQ